MKLLSNVLGASLLSAGLAFSAAGSNLFSVEYSGATPLYGMNQSTGVATPIGPTGFDNIGDLTSDTRAGHGEIYGMRISSNELLKIDPVTGAATVAAMLNSPDDMVSLAMDPTTGRLYGNTSVSFGAPFEALYEIDPGTGNCTFIGRITFDDVFSLGFSQGGTLYGVANASSPPELISISLSSGNGTAVAPLQVSSVFDIASRPEDDVMFLAESGGFRLWTLDTGTGNVTDVGSYGASTNLVGLAFSQVPEPATLGLLAMGLPFLLKRRRR